MAFIGEVYLKEGLEPELLAQVGSLLENIWKEFLRHHDLGPKHARSELADLHGEVPLVPHVPREVLLLLLETRGLREALVKLLRLLTLDAHDDGISGVEAVLA